MIRLKSDLAGVCGELLHEITQGQYETADKFLEPEKLKKYEADVARMAKDTAGDMEYIQELTKLKKTAIDYSYDPMAVLGMIKVETKAKKPDRIIQLDRENNAVNMYTVVGKKAVRGKMDPGFVLPFRFLTIEACNNVYLNGGDNDHGYFLKSMYLYDELRGTLIAMASMHEGRSRHAAVASEDRAEIYIVGGESDQGTLSTCERYEIKNNLWKPLPKLAQKRCGASVSLLGTVLYTAFGWDNNDYLNSIEKLDISAEGNWETLKMPKKQTLPYLQSPGMLPINDHEIMVFGGYKEGEELSKECVIVDIRAKTVKKAKEMAEAEAFIASEAKKMGEVIYAFGYTKGGIHVYDADKDEWTFTEQAKIPQ